MTKKKISFQGELGAYSDMACRQAMPDFETLPCPDFASAIRAVQKGDAELGMIPIDNSLAGRVPAIHLLLPESGLHIIGEHFLPVHHCLLGTQDADLSSLEEVRSHMHALPQCQKIIQELDLKEHISGDTAKAAREVASMEDPKVAAISSELAADIYGLKVLKNNIQDEDHNMTRFLILSREPEDLDENLKDEDVITTLLFRVRNIPAALYKALGGFATNGVNMTKLESYMLGGEFHATQFYLDIQGKPSSPAVSRALQELDYFTASLKILGSYKAHPLRLS